jgi:hypothetical protein
MLSDHERETLLDIEHRLLAEDPGWIMAFDATRRRIGRRRAVERTVDIVALVLSVALSALMFVAHVPRPALFFATVTGLLIWMIRRLRRTARGRTGSTGTGDADTDETGPTPT